ncbi:MAG: exodeoxyribonuclease VII large subunit [Actinobacteria bacterium]|nr:exodeoxyribonuclease VII large subunit [Actinomycetota bacterium]
MTEPAAIGQSPDSALKVHQVSKSIGDWVAKLGRVWVEGQVIKSQVYGQLAYIAFRDPDLDISIQVVASTSLIEGLSPPLTEGSRIVMHASVEWWNKKGDIKLRAHAIQNVGVGDLLVRIQMLRNALEAEGLFKPERKKKLPFLPRKVGLITGRDTDALKDVVVNARRRWPSTQFEIKEIPLQQQGTPLAATKAMQELEAMADVDVIVIARGGGSFEDLLPWSDEGLVRAVAKCSKPVVSAIGHEADHPILDDVADVRASTPTDAARKIVPDLEDESAQVARNASRLQDLKTRWFDEQNRYLAFAKQTLAAKSPKALVEIKQGEIKLIQQQLRTSAQNHIKNLKADLQANSARLKALSPFNVLARGYAVATDKAGNVIRDGKTLNVGEVFNIQVEAGTFGAQKVKE